MLLNICLSSKLCIVKVVTKTLTIRSNTYFKFGGIMTHKQLLRYFIITSIGSKILWMKKTKSNNWWWVTAIYSVIHLFDSVWTLQDSADFGQLKTYYHKNPTTQTRTSWDPVAIDKNKPNNGLYSNAIKYHLLGGMCLIALIYLPSLSTNTQDSKLDHGFVLVSWFALPGNT